MKLCFVCFPQINQEVEAFAKNLNLNYIETSAKDGTNVDYLFHVIVSDCAHPKTQDEKQQLAEISVTPVSQSKWRWICSL